MRAVHSLVSSVGASTLKLQKPIAQFGAVILFGIQVLRVFFQFGVRRAALVDEIYKVGVHSVLTTVLTGFFVGAIMAIQLDLQLRDFGAQSYLGGLSASVTIRNVGPVLIAFILAGKVGAFTSAELGTMQVTDQINAIRCLGVDPIRYLVVPRLLAVLAASFLLLIIGLIAAIAGGIILSTIQLGINWISFVRGIPSIVTGWSVMVGVGKSLCFGAILAVVCCYQGYHAQGGSAGVGMAVRRTAVQSLVSILVANYLLGLL